MNEDFSRSLDVLSPWPGLAASEQSSDPLAPWFLDRSAIRSEPLLYAIGDIHGCDDLLAELLALIDAEVGTHDLPATVIFLGDVVNRGPQTRQVLERLIRGPTTPRQQWIVLRGNHEQVMLDAVAEGDTASFRRWLKMGGMQSLASYGGTRKHATPERARRLIHPHHLRFLAGLPLTHLAGGHLFVHAGIDPDLPLHRQQGHKLMTIRKRFLTKPHRLPYVVVHGHTPTPGNPLLGPGRIGVDTGACTTGILTALAIGPGLHNRRFLRATAVANLAPA